MLNSGVELMLVGMGIVFLFLALLVFTVSVMAWIIRRYFPAPEPEEAAVKRAPPAEGDVVAVIGAAVHAFRSKR
ncbi:MAG: OadG family protein [Pseudomonadota bacterium]